MADRLLASHLLAKVAPAGLLFYLLAGSSGTTRFEAMNNMVEECSKSVDYVAFVFAAVGVAVALFLLRIAASPRSEKETTGMLGNRIGAGVIALLSVLLLYKGISAEGMTDLKTCSDSFDVS
jgi:uncharacterized membrane protein YeaQ/YmgE (transglycosylase-associated protein family)